MDNGSCQFYETPTAEQVALFKISDPEIVLGCKRKAGDGPLHFFVPVPGGAVRVRVCAQHAAALQQHFGTVASE